MPLTNPAWQWNGRLASATVGGRPLNYGDSGPPVQILRGVLERMGFERTLEPVDFYGDSTRNLIRAFEELYELPDNGGAAGKLVLETLDDILNGIIPSRRMRASQPPSATEVIGAAFARKYLSRTNWWIQNAIGSCAEVLANRSTPDKIGETAALAMLQHFRLAVSPGAFLDIYFNRYQDSLFLKYLTPGDTDRVFAAVKKIKTNFETMKTLLNKDFNTIFISVANPPAHPDWIAWWDFGDKIIKCSTTNFRERSAATPNGYDWKSASWVSVHEGAHGVIGEASQHGHPGAPGAADNPYSRHPSYYQMSWQQCLTNPDSYAHFAYQTFDGKQNLGPWT